MVPLPSRMRVLCLAASVVLLGCATGRTVISLPPLKAGTPVAAKSVVKAVTIEPVMDERVYEDAPTDPSTPSLGLELASRASDAIKARAVARKRHGYGLAQGDVLLGSADTAARVVHENLSFAMRAAGVKVAERGEGDGAEEVVKVRLKHFWLWLEPGVMVGTIRSRITTTIQMGQEAPWSVTAETSQPGQIFSEEAWTHAVELALEAYRKQVAAQLASR